MSRILISLLILLSSAVAAQNLIPNPGFESKNDCPEKPGQIKLANFWFSPTLGTPDYFNACSPGMDYGTEFNKQGGQLPRSGQAYAGLQFYLLNRNEHYEYIQTRLDSTLTAGQYYCITAWVSLGDARYAFRQLGALLSVNEIKLQIMSKINYPFFKLENGNYLLEREGWTCIRGLYRAKGGERFLTLGGYNPKDDFWNIDLQSPTDSLFKSTFYFIDDVSVIGVADPTGCTCR